LLSDEQLDAVLASEAMTSPGVPGEKKKEHTDVHRIAALLLAAMLATAAVGAQQRAQHGKLFPPENLGLLEGSDRDVWQRPDQIMDELGIAENSVVADLGAGSGWFTIRLARRVLPKGIVYAEDIQRQMIEVIDRRVKRENLHNVITTLGTPEDPNLPTGALDAVLIVDAYHEMEQPVALLRNAAKALKPEGRIGIVQATMAGGGPGPPMDERVDPERVIREANAAGLVLISRPNILRFQYMLVFGRPNAAPQRGKPPAGAPPRTDRGR
jgi:2-polyprenyl-3-methyl-5-hydroxy-6-metoxy-1,4-benzoquinol methylase